MSRVVVHLTSHACRVADPKVEPPARTRGDDTRAYLIAWSVGHRCRNGAVFTTNPDHVTCKWCRQVSTTTVSDYPGGGRNRPMTWERAVEQSLVECCIQRGVPDPRPLFDQLADERRRRAEMLLALAKATKLGFWGDPDEPDVMGVVDLGAAELAALGPLVTELRELRDDSRSLGHRRRDLATRIAAVAATVNQRGLVALPGGAR